MKPGHMGREHQEAFGEKTIRLKGKLVNHLAYPGGELEEPSVKVLQNQRWAQPGSQWIVFDAGESPGEETKILVVALLPARLGVMQAPSPLWAQFPCLQTGSGSGLDHLAWKEPPISGVVSISGPRAQLASASQVWRPETWFQVGRAHVPSARV